MEFKIYDLIWRYENGHPLDEDELIEELLRNLANSDDKLSNLEHDFEEMKTHADYLEEELKEAQDFNDELQIKNEHF